MEHCERCPVADAVARVTRWWRRDELHEGSLPAWQSAHATAYPADRKWASLGRDAFVNVRDGIQGRRLLAAQSVRGFKAKGISPQHLKALIDPFIVRDNPLVDIRNTRHVRTVVKAGVVYDPADQLRSVEGKIGPKEN